ncbi:MAG: radical SAM family heme chaperone HemW [Gammaproteobacteria bacterium]
MAAMSAPLAVYVHLPWCVRKCPYCDFNSHAVPGSIPENTYVEALLADLEADLDLAAGREVGSIFLGGGTPSLFHPDSIAALIAGIDARLPLAAQAEITMEANPGTVEHGRFEGYAAAGINRVSLGAQSFDAAALAALGRIHGPGEIPTAVAEIRAAGIDNFNLDLMYALPGQALAGTLADIEAAIALSPAHLSHYQLTLEPGTAFFHRPPLLPPDDLAWEMQVECQRLLAAAGFAQYEVSAYARPGRQCRHNLNYWHYGDYLGIGAGAHGKATVNGAVVRTEKARSPRAYLECGGRAGARRTVAAEELPFEFMLNALRLDEGFTLDEYGRATGLAPEALTPQFEALAARGLLERPGDRVRPTALGFRFLNDLQAEFLPGCTRAAKSPATAPRR